MRWDPYCIFKGQESASFWTKHLEQGGRRVLCIMGKGFDRRMCLGIQMLRQSAPESHLDCMLLEFDEGEHSPSQEYGMLIESNMATLASILPPEHVRVASIQMWADEDGRRRRVGHRSAADVFQSPADFAPYTDVVLDISALPRGLYLPILGSILSIVPQKCNLHVLVAENVVVDGRIKEAGLDEEAHYLPGFKGSLELEATAEWPRIWIPILGEGQAGQLERIHTLVDPIEICPVLPWPSSRTRRADELVAEYHVLLFDTWRVDPRNFIYASEDNPFHAYKSISKAVKHYDSALRELGGCKVAISALSSKLLSIGAFLAAYELMEHNFHVGLPHVESQGYEYIDMEQAADAHLVSLWISGECYEA